MDINQYIELIQKYSKENYSLMIRKPEGMINHPFIVPGSKTYSNCLWDWDSWLTNIAVRQIMKDNDDDNIEFTECGFSVEAKDLAEKTIRLFGEDLEKCGEFHEYYHPDMGEGVNNKGFQNY